MRKIVLVILIVISSIISFGADLTGTTLTTPEIRVFNVGGDFDKFYPVLWRNTNWTNGATELEITRADTHVNSSWRGTIIAKFRFHTTNWGHGSAFIDADIRNSGNRFVAGWKDVTGNNSSSCILIWLRGGGTTYRYRSNNDMINVPKVYLDENGYPQEEGHHKDWITYHKPKTSVDSYVNSNGMSYSGNASFNGNVGIGTANPKAALHLYKDRYTLYGPNSSWGEYLQVGGNGRVTSYASVAATNGNLHLDAKNGNFSTYINWYSKNRTIINGRGGNVLIGKSNDTGQKLQVEGSASINGTLHTSELVVTQNVWADYVFENNYKLRPLEEVAKFVKSNKHLPDIPSEKEVKSKGVSVGDMQAKLLQKVEELTLYMIELKKENEDMKNEIAKLKNK
ncbi:hypothetical protein [Haliovirga abyssi]|uniref:Uncharacterized protein n=1 Tax=Haliovirga abyssi TaxID=2996794 RepID=A0AAU9DLE1_9FUSO|nr:hypothetical protein [Haliovirga abyssi]BDU51689.1 hypothetical protein HLVA_22580 [Haliovirga abyssi]